VRRAHLAPLRAEGTIDVEHGLGSLARLIIRLMKLPAAGPHQPVHLDVTKEGAGLVWTRRIGDTILRTRQHATATGILERSGLGRISFVLTVADGALLYEQTAFVVAGLPVPRWLGPSVRAVVSPTATGWHVEVTVTWRGQPVCRYAGAIRAT